MGKQPRNKNNHFQKSVFFNVKSKLLMNKSKFFSVSSTCFQRSSRSQTLFKIRALENFAIPELKRDSTQVFSCKKQPLGGALFWKLIDVKVSILKNWSIPQSSALSDETRAVQFYSFTKTQIEHLAVKYSQFPENCFSSKKYA